MSIQTAFSEFMSDDFEAACISSTKASFSGSGYSVELFNSGDYRVVWDDNIGNLYKSAGLILPVPSLGDEEYDSENDEHYFDNARQAMLDVFEESQSV